MRFVHHFVKIFPVICVASGFYGQSIGTIEDTHLKQIKSENGLILSWQSVSTDAKAKQVEVFDQTGHLLTSVNILRLVPEAERVGIYDVSAKPGHVIAIAAVYRKADHHLRPVATLVLFDFSGRLLSAFALEPSRQILRLAVGTASIWTITSHSDNKDPSTTPMVVEYSTSGTVLRELLTRDKFPIHARETQESLKIGAPFLGYDSHGLWFWLPGSTDLVTISSGDGRATISKTQTPGSSAGKNDRVPISMVREPSGLLVAQVRDLGNQGAKISNYDWSAATGWSSLKGGSCEDGKMIGATEEGLLYLEYEPPSLDKARICLSSSKIRP